MWVLIVILFAFALVLMVFTYFGRKNKPDEEVIQIKENPECCGAHAVCERESLLNTENKIEYYDDEELDSLSGLSPEQYSEEQMELLSEVFYSLQEKDVSGWLRSMQMRGIELPQQLREEALLIVSERRNLC
ncbi:MAG: phospholipase [Paludibacteraceae bacterium]|nr:phospholipase [Paludibacteraceae bacterium]